jgi:hypothetical protein
MNFETILKEMRNHVQKLEETCDMNFRLLQANDQKIETLTRKCNWLYKENNTLKSQVYELSAKERATRNNLNPDSVTITRAAQATGFKNAAKLNAEFLRLGIMYQRGAKKLPLQKYIDAGYFQIQSCQPFVTRAGLEAIKKWKAQGFFRI